MSDDSDTKVSGDPTPKPAAGPLSGSAIPNVDDLVRGLVRQVRDLRTRFDEVEAYTQGLQRERPQLLVEFRETREKLVVIESAVKSVSSGLDAVSSDLGDESKKREALEAMVKTLTGDLASLSAKTDIVISKADDVIAKTDAQTKMLEKLVAPVATVFANPKVRQLAYSGGASIVAILGLIAMGMSSCRQPPQVSQPPPPPPQIVTVFVPSPPAPPAPPAPQGSP